MQIYGPSDRTEFVPVIGGLTENEFQHFEQRLLHDMPDVRYQKHPDQEFFAQVQRFTLVIHRDDRNRAISSIYETIESLRLRPGINRRIVAREQEIAALVRQYVRAKEANDAAAIDVMASRLSFSLALFLDTILHFAESFQDRRLREELHLSHQRVNIRDITTTAHFALVIVGVIDVHVARLVRTVREPLVAEIRTSEKAPTLDTFVVRFGDWDRLVATQYTPSPLPSSLACVTCPYRITIGESIAYPSAQPVRWAFEFAKVEEAKDEE
jgi:hypothetical protein